MMNVRDRTRRPPKLIVRLEPQRVAETTPTTIVPVTRVKINAILRQEHAFGA